MIPCGIAIPQDLLKAPADMARVREFVARADQLAYASLWVTEEVLGGAPALDATGRISMINKSGATLLEDSVENLIGLNWFDHFLPPGQQNLVSQVFSELMAGRGEFLASYENGIITRQGNKRIIAWHNVCLLYTSPSPRDRTRSRMPSSA